MVISKKKLYEEYERYFNEGTINGLRMAIAVLKDPMPKDHMPMEDKIKRLERMEEAYDEKNEETL